ncbi:MAG: outer membrane protein transport protein [Deltaproteobacteria bacterium]|nr:outer membrane protein transport protein [Deltaproteobacteria bacterium]
MQKIQVVLIGVLFAFIISPAAFATNGDNLISIGPISRAMGGVGIAAPQDAISAVFSNPASMCFGSFCPASSFDFAGTLFMPAVSARVKLVTGDVGDDSDDDVFAIPAIGLSVPISPGMPAWRFGIAAYGVSGLGVDYRETALDDPAGFDFGEFGTAPLIAGEYTALQIMKFAPAIAVQPMGNLSLGLALHIDYATLDLRQGSSPTYAYGIQAGLIYKPSETISLGLSYISPQTADHKNVAYFDDDNFLDSLELEVPQQVGIGAAYNLPDLFDVLIEVDIKWINWSDSTGYDDFDWGDQWVYAIGLQLKPSSKLSLRIGYNYAKQPLDVHDGFDGTFMPNNVQSVQGKEVPTYYYETFRIIGFPAIIEKHLTFGIGYEFAPRFSVHLGYMLGFEEKISETGTDLFGRPVTIESTLSEESLDFGLTWMF